jgi:hypothetical protein
MRHNLNVNKIYYSRKDIFYVWSTVSLWSPYTLTEIIIPFLQNTTDNEHTRMLWPHSHSNSKQEIMRIRPEVKMLTHETPWI